MLWHIVDVHDNKKKSADIVLIREMKVDSDLKLWLSGKAIYVVTLLLLSPALLSSFSSNLPKLILPQIASGHAPQGQVCAKCQEVIPLN